MTFKAFDTFICREYDLGGEVCHWEDLGVARIPVGANYECHSQEGVSSKVPVKSIVQASIDDKNVEDGAAISIGLRIIVHRYI